MEKEHVTRISELSPIGTLSLRYTQLIELIPVNLVLRIHQGYGRIYSETTEEVELDEKESAKNREPKIYDDT